MGRTALLPEEEPFHHLPQEEPAGVVVHHGASEPVLGGDAGGVLNRAFSRLACGLLQHRLSGGLSCRLGHGAANMTNGVMHEVS